jgi:hypothetical protein
MRSWLARNWEDAHANLEEKLRIQYNAEWEVWERNVRAEKDAEITDLRQRKDMLEHWLIDYRDQLKKENAYHKNTGIINAINELLNES